MDKYDEILLAVSTSEEIDQGIILTAAQQLVDSALEGLNGTRASIWLVDSRLNEISCFTSVPEFPVHVDTTYPTNTDENTEFLKMLDQERFFLSYGGSDFMMECNDSTGQPSERSAIDCAIRYRGELIGILRCEDDKRRKWTVRESRFLANLADMVGRGLLAQRWQSAEEALHKANESLEEKVKSRTVELSETLEELYTVQDQLVESEKMAALGGLVAGVAHEINTPLGICITSISHLKSKADQLEEVFESGNITEEDLRAFLKSSDETLELSQHHLQRTANLVKSFKQVAVDQSVDEISTFNLHDKLEELIVSFRHELRRVSACLLLECPTTLKITTYPGVLDQVITNLVMNSIYHGLEGVQNGIIKVDIKLAGDDGLRMVFSDNGCGIPVDNRKKIFEPFFTTRRNKGGTGLGLNILYNLVNHKMQGKVKLSDDIVQGAAFEITLPLTVK
jgi:signal transduction histidine kinase